MKRGFLLVMVALAGCGVIGAANISQMDAPELKTVSDQGLCHPLVGGPAVMAERAARGLGDCDPNHLRCLDMGLKPGTDMYAQCRMQAAQMDAAAYAQWQQGFQKNLDNTAKPAPHPSVTDTNCTTWGDTMKCRSTTQP